MSYSDLSNKSVSFKMAINPTTTKTFEQDSNAHFPIVGIGASAGGLDAIKGFLHHVPRKSGMAFVVIQHLDPNYHGMLPELLQHSTEMKVVQADNCMKVYPDCVYVIPPNKDISISKGIACGILLRIDEERKLSRGPLL